MASVRKRIDGWLSTLEAIQPRTKTMVKDVDEIHMQVLTNCEPVRAFRERDEGPLGIKRGGVG